MDAPRLEFQSCPGDPLLPAVAAPAAVIALLALWALTVLLFPAAAVGTLALLGAAAAAMLAGVTRRSAEWLIFALLLIVEILPSATFLPITEAQRPLLRYPLYLLFCLPLIPRVWRSGILGRGGFRLYAIYFVWAFISTAYSLSPLFSFGRALGSGLLFVALCSIALDVDDGKKFQRVLLHVLAACAIATAILAVTAIVPALHSAWFVDQELGRLRFRGMFDSPNQVGELSMITIGTALTCWVSLRGAGARLAAAVLIAVSALLLVAADSRSPGVAMLLGAAALAIWRYRWRGAAAVALGAILMLLAAGQLNPQALLYLTRHNVSTLTGRTVVMRFSLHKLMKSPLVGYGFGVEGMIFHDKFFPFWDKLWQEGPRIPIHNGYLSRAIGLGIPAALLWLFLFIRPFAALFAGRDDRCGLKRPALLLVLPVLILYLSETLGGDCRFPAGLISTLVWAMAEQQRLRVKAARARKPDETAARLSGSLFPNLKIIV